ncbi:MAG: DUF1786 domain-containing protein [Desulfovibrionaceae bacterium]|nr:DUF1786 domain-containing protein [Desulfovibrionaceae bacterium]
MNAQVAAYLNAVGPVLCLDIGSGTQDALLARPGLEPENWTQLVLPSPAKAVERRVAKLTAARRDVWLYGGNMGGGFTRALKRHVEAGLRVSVTLEASRAIHDSEERVAALGFELRESCPAGAVPVHLGDYSPEWWDALLEGLGLPRPRMVLAAAQDHGVAPQGNRQARMDMWRALLARSSHPADWLYDSVPAGLTRLAALHRATGGPVADTSTAAVLGGLCSAGVRRRAARQGVTLVNTGNSHITAFLLYRDEVHGVFEHHTGMRTLEDYVHDLKEFRLGWLPDEQVRATGGHGTAFGGVSEEAGGYAPTYLLGPRRAFLEGQGQNIAPCGNMMLAGCYGLLRGAAERFSR